MKTYGPTISNLKLGMFTKPLEPQPQDSLLPCKFHPHLSNQYPDCFSFPCSYFNFTNYVHNFLQCI